MSKKRVGTKSTNNIVKRSKSNKNFQRFSVSLPVIHNNNFLAFTDNRFSTQNHQKTTI
jgi:hypothetical protein